MTASDYRANARRKLSGNGIYLNSVLTFFISWLIVYIGPSLLSSVVGVHFGMAYYSGNQPGVFRSTSMTVVAVFLSLVSLAVCGAVKVGLAQYQLKLADGLQADIDDLFSQFRHFGNTFLYALLRIVLVSLWSLLFVIPGIVAWFSYSMTPYILAEHPEIRAYEAMKMSKEMMRGHKRQYFCLLLSFIGWYILSGFTSGIGSFFLQPYVEMAKAEFFNEISGKNFEKQRNTYHGGSTFTGEGNVAPYSPDYTCWNGAGNYRQGYTPGYYNANPGQTYWQSTSSRPVTAQEPQASQTVNDTPPSFSQDGAPQNM